MQGTKCPCRSRAGCAAGIAVGALVVIIWDYIPCISGMTPSAATGLYSLVPGFFLSLAANAVVSLLTKAPDDTIMQEFDDARKKPE